MSFTNIFFLYDNNQDHDFELPTQLMLSVADDCASVIWNLVRNMTNKAEFTGRPTTLASCRSVHIYTPSFAILLKITEPGVDSSLLQVVLKGV